MKKRIFALTAAALSALLLFAACGEEVHKHTFSKDWTSSETEHWHAATCGDTDERSAVSNHNFRVVSTTATCTEEGVETVVCSVCKKELTRTAAPLGHAFEVTPREDPTCEQNGVTELRVCTREGCGHREGGEPIFKTGHVFKTDWSYSASMHFHEALCECKQITDSAFHTFNEENKCTVCSYEYTTEEQDALLAEDFDVTQSGSTYTVNGLKEGVEKTEIELPAYIDMKPVTAIADGAFKGNTELVSVKIPDTVSSIGRYAFDECTALAEADLPAWLTEIGEQAFSDTAITSAVIPVTLTTLPDNVFLGCEELAEVTIAGNLKKIGNQVFYGCKALHTLSLPKSLTYIGQRAFAASGLTEVTVPSSVTELGSFAFENCVSLATADVRAGLERHFGGWFAGCSALTGITVPFVGSHTDPAAVPTSTAFGYLFGQKAGEKLTAVEQGGVTYYIPASLKKVTVLGGYVAEGAFDNCSMLTEIIGRGVTWQATVFTNCTASIAK